MRSRAILLPSGAHGRCEVFENGDGVLPVDAGISDTDTLLQRRGAFLRDLLVAFVDVGLNHDANDGALSLAELLSDYGSDLGLVLVVLLGVACADRVSEYSSWDRSILETYRVSSQS